MRIGDFIAQTSTVFRTSLESQLDRLRVACRLSHRRLVFFRRTIPTVKNQDANKLVLRFSGGFGLRWSRQFSLLKHREFALLSWESR